MNEFSSKQEAVSSIHSEAFLKLLAPFAPHLTEELWYQLGHKTSIHKEKWPKYDAKLVKEELLTVAVQVNGKLRAIIQIQANTSPAEVEKVAKKNKNVKRHLEGKKVRKVIYVQGKIVNFVT